MNEYGLKKQVDAYLKKLAPEVLFEKRWGGGLFSREGVADYTGCAWGSFFAIELKHPEKRAHLTAAQIAYQEKVLRAGGRFVTARSLQQVKDFMARLRASCSSTYDLKT
jgi:hypothetical protein